MSLSFTRASLVASAGQKVTLGNLIGVSGTNNPAYLVVSGLDRTEYTVKSNGNTGTLTGNGQTATFTTQGGDAKGFGILFSYDAASGQYVNAQYGSLAAMTLTTSTDTNRNEAISLYGANDASLLTPYLNSSVSLLSAARSSYIGTLSVVTAPSLAGQTPAQATPGGVAAVAQTFVGQTWNANGCWTLACAISAEAGASLPTMSTLVSTPGQSNGEWMVAYNGPNGDTANWQSMVTAGDVVVFKTASGTGHIATVAAGSGANATLIDNTVFLNGDGTVFNSAHDGSDADITINWAHAASDEFSGVAGSSVVIYRLDTPVVSAPGALFVNAGQTKSLGNLIAATDPAGKAIVSYQVYDTTAQDRLSTGGSIVTASNAASAVTLSAAAMAGTALLAGTGISSSATGTLMVRAFNGTYWGDWASVKVTVTPSTVNDTAASVASGLSALTAAAQAGTISAISLTDAGTPVLSLTAAQLAANRAAVDKIIGHYLLAVTGDNATLTIAGSHGTNLLRAGLSGGNHSLYAGAGLQGADTIIGGYGADVLYGSTNAAGTALLIAGGGNNVLNGGLGADQLIGGGNSTLNAGAAYQVLLGGYANNSTDTLNGGVAGHDFLAVATGSNVLNAGAGQGTVLEGGTGADTLNGSSAASGAAVLIGGKGATVLNGGLGADTLVGGGQSVLNAGAGAPQLLLGGYGAGAHDTLNAGTNNATLAVATGNNVLDAGSGNAVLLGGAGNDLLNGGGGSGVLVGGAGHSTLLGGAGSDTLIGTGQSLLIGGSGAAGGRSLLLGGYSANAHDTLAAGTGSNETLAVAMGNNQLQADGYGLGANDTLMGGAGNDTMYGGATTTNFIVNNGSSQVVGGSGDDLVTVNGAGSLTFDGGSGGNNAVAFAGHASNAAVFTTNASGATLVSFAGSSQTATLTRVASVSFADGVTHKIG